MYLSAAAAKKKKNNKESNAQSVVDQLTILDIYYMSKHYSYTRKKYGRANVFHSFSRDTLDFILSPCFPAEYSKFSVIFMFFCLFEWHNLNLWNMHAHTTYIVIFRKHSSQMDEKVDASICRHAKQRLSPVDILMVTKICSGKHVICNIYEYIDNNNNIGSRNDYAVANCSFICDSSLWNVRAYVRMHRLHTFFSELAVGIIILHM